MRQGVLAKVVLAAIDSPDFKTKLLNSPAEVARTLRLDASDVGELAAIGSDGFDALMGSMIIHRVLPFPVGRRLMIAPIDFAGDIHTEREVIRLDQGREGAWIGASGTSEIEDRVFGSGSHPTTVLCLEILDASLTPGQSVLDLGSGSGVVAIAAGRLGASSVDACDIDPFAVETTQENVEANGLQDLITATQDDFHSLSTRVEPGAYDLIVSNILAPVHEANLRDGLARLLRPGGRIILSGFKENHVPDLRTSMEDEGLELESVRQSDPWVAMTGHRI
jgi:ribosomal protein L11 methyltransferase